MTYRIAAVSFLNARPLVADLAGRDDVELVADVPSQLPELLYEDRADVALVPVVEWFRGAGAAILPGMSLATGGRVDSVKVFATVAPPDIRHVAVDRGSRTSVALLRVLFAELWGVEPDFKVAEPHVDSLLDEADAALVIGDRCFKAEQRFREDARRDVYEMDLGEAWRQMTGLPFVFAVWVTGSSFAERTRGAGMTGVASVLAEAKASGLARLEELADEAVAEGRLGPGGRCDREAILRYFTRSMNYDLGYAELAGLERFHRLCVRHRIVPDGRGIDTAALIPGNAE